MLRQRRTSGGQHWSSRFTKSFLRRCEGPGWPPWLEAASVVGCIFALAWMTGVADVGDGILANSATVVLELSSRVDCRIGSVGFASAGACLRFYGRPASSPGEPLPVAEVARLPMPCMLPMSATEFWRIPLRLFLSFHRGAIARPPPDINRPSPVGTSSCWADR